MHSWPTPASVKEVRSFLGLTPYYCCFTAKFATISVNLTGLLQKTVPFVWSHQERRFYNDLRDRLLRTPFLIIPNFLPAAGIFVTDTDTGVYAIGAMLSQHQSNGVENVVAIASPALSARDRECCIASKGYHKIWSRNVLRKITHGSRNVDALHLTTKLL